MTYTRKIRPVSVVGNEVHVPLTRGMTAIVDLPDKHHVEGYNWQARKDDDRWYAVRVMRHDDDGKQHMVYMHRSILDAPAGVTVDHKDGDGLNNRRVNIRLATHQENMFNQRTPKDNTSGYKGVCWNKASRKWQAQISVGGRTVYLGLFETAEQASSVYETEATRRRGVFHRGIK